MTLIREDSEGLYLKSGGVTARPGSVNGYGHAYRMDDGGLIKGDKVTARHIGGTSMVKIKLPDGRITRWFSDEPERDRGLGPAPEGAEWDDKGVRVFPKHEEGAPSGPREITAITGNDIIRILNP